MNSHFWSCPPETVSPSKFPLLELTIHYNKITLFFHQLNKGKGREQSAKQLDGGYPVPYIGSRVTSSSSISCCLRASLRSRPTPHPTELSDDQSLVPLFSRANKHDTGRVNFRSTVPMPRIARRTSTFATITFGRHGAAGQA